MSIKKTWFEILSPAAFGSKPIGQTLAAEPKLLVGRALSIALPDLGIESKKFFIKLNLRIDSIDGTKAMTRIVGHDCMSERIYRMVQRHSRRVDCVQDVQSKDAKIRVKTVAIIPRRVSTSIKDAARAKIVETVSKLVSNMTFEEFIKAVTEDKLQTAIKEACKKIYPVAAVEIRKSEVL